MYVTLTTVRVCECVCVQMDNVKKEKYKPSGMLLLIYYLDIFVLVKFKYLEAERVSATESNVRTSIKNNPRLKFYANENKICAQCILLQMRCLWMVYIAAYCLSFDMLSVMLSKQTPFGFLSLSLVILSIGWFFFLFFSCCSIICGFKQKMVYNVQNIA